MWRPSIKNDLLPLLNLAIPLVLTSIVQSSLSFHKYGENDQLGIIHVLRDGLLLALILTIPTFLLFWNISSVFFLFGQSHQLAELA